MKVLAIETSGSTASVAIIDQNQVVCEYTTNFKKTHSVTLMPMIDEICKAVDLDVAEIELIAVSSGPGSFTGLRIGSATAKGLAHALNIPIASIPTLEGLANNIDRTDLLICPMMDARRNQVYTALYAYEGNEIKALTEMMCTEIDHLIEKIFLYDLDVLFLGDGYKPNEEKIKALFAQKKSKIEKNYRIAKPQNMFQRASSIGLLGIKCVNRNQLQTYMEHVPIYLRKPQAEREYEEKNKTTNN